MDSELFNVTRTRTHARETHARAHVHASDLNSRTAPAQSTRYARYTASRVIKGNKSIAKTINLIYNSIHREGVNGLQKQTSIYLSESDKIKLETIKKVYEVDKMAEAVKIAISAEYDNIMKYATLKTLKL